jgi:predicted dehydrogenase
MPTPFRIAFIGIDHPHGAGWRELLPNLQDSIEIQAVVPSFGGSLASLEERYAQLPRFDNVVDLLASAKFDGAIVCLSNRETPAVVRALAEAGKHVLMEKPGAATEAAFQSAAQALRTGGVAFQSGYMWRYNTGTDRVRAMIDEGRFEKLISIEIRQFTSDVSRRGHEHYLFDSVESGRGFFNWLGCHWLDLIPYLTNDRVAAVTARVGCFGSTAVDLEDGGTVILELERGTLVTLTGGYWLPRWAGELELTLHGSQRWVHWEPNFPGSGGRLRIHGPQPQFHAMEETFDLPASATPGYGGAMGVATIRDWIALARGEVSKCRNTIDSTIETLRLLDAVYRSSDEGCRVVL